MVSSLDCQCNALARQFTQQIGKESLMQERGCSPGFVTAALTRSSVTETVFDFMNDPVGSPDALQSEAQTVATFRQ